eukprot:g1452.t1 g1452   contig10:2120624-2124621(-)
MALHATSRHRDFNNPLTSQGSRQQKDASMERALRSLSPTSSPMRMNSPQRVMQKGNLKNVVSTTANKANACSEESVKVAIRIRPLAPNNETDSISRAFRASAGNTVIETPNLASAKTSSVYSMTPSRRQTMSGDTEYAYDKVFGEDADTSKIYDELVSDIVESVANEGINGTVFTYGQTSSGKTFTMQGCGKDEDGTVGIIQMAAKEIFGSIKAERSENEFGGVSTSESTVKVSYIEIYNEELRDLLTDNKRKAKPTALTIREDKRGSIAVENLKEVAVRSLDQLMEVFRVGESNKAVGSTKMNDRSSRSHAILRITIEKKTVLYSERGVMGEDKENNEAASPNNKAVVVKSSSTLNLVDLAGSESVRLTGASGMQKKEGGMINQSLLTLSKVLMSLGQKKTGHVNYRDSKLTRILKPSLSGNARMAVICCISPSDQYVDETKSTLQFATRAKLVKTNAVANEVIDNDSALVAKLQLENERAKVENSKLQAKLPKGRKTHSAAHTSKDDLHIPFDDTDHSSPSIAMLRAALEFKSQQLESLQEELLSRPSTKKKKRSFSRFSISAYQAIDNYQSQTEDLESKLTNANSLIATLESQVDELSSQKNDALDWIEELFSKSDQKEDQVKQAFKARDEAASKSDALEMELAKLKEVLEFTIGDLERTSKENRTLSYENEEAKSRMNAMRSEIEALKYCLNANDDTSDKTDVTKELSCSHDEHDTAFLSSEPQSSPTVTIAVSKAESLEAANKQLKQQINELTNQIEAKNDFSSEYDKEKNLLLQRIKLLEGELVEKQNLLAQKSEELEDTVFSFESEKKRLKKENTELAEQIRESSTIASDRNIREVSDEVNRTKNECDTLKAENARLISEQRYLKQLAEKAETGRRDFSMQLEISKQRLIKSEAALAKAENERSESVEQLNAANSKIKENIVLLSETKKELTVLQRANANLEKRDTELRGSVVRIRELVDELTHENADLKTKNECCQRAIDSLENRTWELESHLNESNELKIRHRQLNEAHDRLMQEFKIASNERENAIYEKEKVKRRLDSIAGAFEADYETVRSKIDLLVCEKRVLERQVALLEASKASVEGNADRILERDNAIVGQNDRLRTECQKQSIKVANLQDEINQLVRRLSCLKKENERLSRDNDALRDAVTFTQAKFLEQDQRLKRRKIFEFHSTK